MTTYIKTTPHSELEIWSNTHGQP